jgi:hypothetical protein
MLALLCIFCTTAALELHEFIGEPGGLPAICAIAANYLMAATVALWIQIDAYERGKSPAYDFDTLVFILWPIVAPVYLFRTRGAGAFGPLGAVVGVTALAYLFALFLGYPHSMKPFGP